MALTKTTVLSHDIRGEYKTINEITDRFIQEDGVQISHDRHRGGPVSPGFLADSELPEAIDGTIYSITDTSPYSSDFQGLAITCWTTAIHTDYEAKLRTT